ncbi:unnamed protein product [Sphagnum jensenii]|uniref:AB hydrolase-1 domain-containing protein n=1 Tax=Sphagnum jensenii TaxID=128206 RepID=A0ABP0WQI2_9BRYO
MTMQLSSFIKCCCSTAAAATYTSVLLFVVGCCFTATLLPGSSAAVATNTRTTSEEISGPSSSVARTAAGQQVVLVHGIGGGAWFFFEVVTLLNAAGFSATAVDLSSNGISKAIADDITSIEQYTQPLTDLLSTIDGQVILLGHSMGGGSISFAMEKFGPSKISKAVFLAAIMPTNGQTFFTSFPPTCFPRLIGAKDLFLYHADGSPGPTSIRANNSQLGFFAFNQSPLQFTTLAQSLFTPTPYRPGLETLNLSTASYGSIRRFYIRTGQDRAILPSEQEEILKANPPERIFELHTADHMAFFSAPIQLFATISYISTL